MTLNNFDKVLFFVICKGAHNYASFHLDLKRKSVSVTDLPVAVTVAASLDPVQTGSGEQSRTS